MYSGKIEWFSAHFVIIASNSMANELFLMNYQLYDYLTFISVNNVSIPHSSYGIRLSSAKITEAEVCFGIPGLSLFRFSSPGKVLRLFTIVPHIVCRKADSFHSASRPLKLKQIKGYVNLVVVRARMHTILLSFKWTSNIPPFRAIHLISYFFNFISFLSPSHFLFSSTPSSWHCEIQSIRLPFSFIWFGMLKSSAFFLQRVLHYKWHRIGFRRFRFRLGACRTCWVICYT